jgi:tetracycline 7-halogenase / FADH2 O2-dependent halogenase
MILQETKHDFDVAILGNGLSGSLLATILSKQGVSVVLIDGEQHPRFAVGESTIPHTSLLISLLAEKYDLPELDDLIDAEGLAKRVCATCGIKRHFGYVYHRPGQTYNPTEGLQFGTAARDENHWFRQDTDAYLHNLAVHYGAVPRQKTKITEIEIDAGGVRLQTSAGEEIRARYLVDGTGYRSILADRFGLRENPTRLKHHSRTLFTHMVDVPPFDDAHNPLPISYHNGTLHHCFERGWFWVIPFNNNPLSTNPIISVGLTIDPRRYPKPELSPEQEFNEFLRRYPSVAEQFEGAKAVRPWVSTGRLQYSSKKTTGYRYCLMSHASGFVDPLFSRGMFNTVEVITALLDPLLEALKTDNFDEEPFRSIDAQQQLVLDYNDNLVNCSFISWNDFDLWNAWLRVFGLGTFLAEFHLMNGMSDYTRTSNPSYLKGPTKDPVFCDFEDPDYAEFFRESVKAVEAVEAGTLDAKDAADRIFKLADSYTFEVPIRKDALVRARWVREEDQLTERGLGRVRRGFRWALTTPLTRDLVNSSQTFFRWCAHQPDPHLLAVNGLEAKPPAQPVDTAEGSR